MKTVTISNSAADRLERLRKQDRKWSRFRRRQRKHNGEPKEGGNMRKRNIEPVATAAPPHADWILIVRRQFSGTRIFPVGAVVSLAECGTNFEMLLANRFVVWSPPTTVAVAKPRDLPPADKPKPKPQVELVPDPDVVESWRKTKARMVKKCGGDAALALDLLMMDKAASDLFLIAQRKAVETERRERKLISCGPSDLRVPL